MHKLSHRFVEFIPEVIEDGVLYVSIAYGTASHRCCCGCGREVVTPLTPTDWKLIFDGETVSLHPSIGNWNSPCRSHYWIQRNRVEWAEDWSDRQVKTADAIDRMEKDEFYGERESKKSREKPDGKPKSRGGFWARFWKSW